MPHVKSIPPYDIHSFGKGTYLIAHCKYQYKVLLRRTSACRSALENTANLVVLLRLELMFDSNTSKPYSSAVSLLARPQYEYLPALHMLGCQSVFTKEIC